MATMSTTVTVSKNWQHLAVNMVEREALQVALELFRSPTLARSAKRMPLPKNVLDVIRIAAGDAFEPKIIEATFGWPEADVRAAAVFYLQQVLFDKNSDDYRLLGLSQGSVEVDVKDHKRALLKWLHPDRNANKWESVLLQRVVKASENILANQFSSNRMQIGPTGMPMRSPNSRHGSQRRPKALQSIESKRIRKPLYWREHLLSFARRMGLLTAVLLFIFLGFKTFAVPENSANILGLARNMLARAN
jgi:hypothetical protein